LLYRTCVALDRESHFQKIEARSEAVALGALVVLVLIGGAIVQTRGFALGWLAETMLCSVGFAIACAMVEPPAALEPTGGRDASGDGSSRDARRRLVLLMLPAALLGGAASAASFLAQTTGASSPMALTMLVAALTASEAAGCAMASRLPPASWRHQFAYAAFGVLLMVSAIADPLTLPFMALALAFLVGVVQPLRAAAIQRLASDDIRARAASAASACDMAVSTIVLPLAGMWRSRRRR
jgi:hypothetical protein